MEIAHGFFDYYVSDNCLNSDNLEIVARRLVQLGYRTVAINQTISDTNLEPKKKKKKGESREVNDVVPPAVEVNKVEGCDELKILNRLTVVFSNQEIFTKIMKSPNFKNYHILAVQPESQQAFQFICNTLEADILTYDPENKANYKINRKLYNQLVDRGFHFELLYGPAVQDSSQRKNMISMAHLYHSFGKSKNIIISSGATHPLLLRSPYDIINLGLIFGLREEQAKNSIQNCGRNVFLHSVGRRHGKAVMFVDNLEEKEVVEKMEKEEEQNGEMELDQPLPKKSKQ